MSKIGGILTESFDKLADEFKARNNPNIINPQIGKIVELKPLKISIMGGKIILTKPYIIMCSYICEKQSRKHDVKINKCRIKMQGSWHEDCQLETIPTDPTDNTFEIKKIFEIGDEVAMIPIGKKFLIIDKISEVE